MLGQPDCSGLLSSSPGQAGLPSCPPALLPSHKMGIGQPGEQTSRQTRHPSTGSPRTGYWPTASGLVHRRYRGPAGGFVCRQWCLRLWRIPLLVPCPSCWPSTSHQAPGRGAVVRWCGGCCAVVVVGGCRRSEKQGSAEPTGVVTQGSHPCCLFLPLGTPPFHTCSIPRFSPVDPSNNLCRASLPPFAVSLHRVPSTDDRLGANSSFAHRPPPFRQPFLTTIAIPLVESDAVTENTLPPARAVVISASRLPTISTTYTQHFPAEWSQQWPTRGGSGTARPRPPGGRRPSTIRRAHRCPSPVLATIPSTPETSTSSQLTTSTPTTTMTTNPSPEAPSSVATPSPPPRHTRQGKTPWAGARA